MTDRVHALTVVLDRDMREDDVECVIDAIRMVRFVADVSPIVTEPRDYQARVRVDQKWRNTLLDLVSDMSKP